MSSRARALPGRFVSVGTKLTLSVIALLVVASTWVVNELSDRARASLIEQKRAGASMVVDLFATTVATAADFGDEDELKSEVKNLGSNPDIVYAAVWLQDAEQPVARLGSAEQASRPDSAQREIRVEPERIIISEPLVRPGAERVGSLTLHFSLAPENAQYERTRRRILIYSLGLAACLAGLVLALVRVQVLVPLGRLNRGIGRVQRGLDAEVKARANDEVGQLAAEFNAMVLAIEDRERRLGELNRRLQQLLDNMREAILVFNQAGRVESIQSREAARVFGTPLADQSIAALLFPSSDASIEAEAFDEWLSLVFGEATDWDELSDLAPKETTLSRGSDSERVLALDFRPIVEDGKVTRMMLLARDETVKRQLQRAVRENQVEHARQLGAMRKLVAGGGQLLVQVLDGARARLRDSAAALSTALDDYSEATNESIFRWAHTVKGEARAFDLIALERAAARLEDELAKLRGRMRDGDAPTVATARQRLQPLIEQALSAVEEAERMLVEASPIGPAILEQVTVRRADLHRLSELVGASGETAKLVERLRSRPFGESTLSLIDSAPVWAARENKRILVEVEGRDVPIPPALARVLSGALTHLVRNAIAHGIETTEEREQLQKPIPARILLSAADTPHGPSIRVVDDGRGLDRAGLEAISAETASSLPKRSAQAEARASVLSSTELAFAPGISTKTHARSTDLAGFGIGLSAVRSELEAISYAVTLNSPPTRSAVERGDTEPTADSPSATLQPVEGCGTEVILFPVHAGQGPR